MRREIDIEHKIRFLLANNIVYFRHKNGWSQEKFAEKLDSNLVYVSQLENARRNVSANTFDVKPLELLIKRETIENRRVDRKR